MHLFYRQFTAKIHDFFLNSLKQNAIILLFILFFHILLDHEKRVILLSSCIIK